MIDFTEITNIDLMLMPILTGQHNVFFDGLAQVLTLGWTWIALYLAIFFVVIKNNETMMQIGLVILFVMLCLLFSDGLPDGIVKPAVARLRPLNTPEIRDQLPLVFGVHDSNYSFFSAHASNTFALCVFFSLLIRSCKLFFALMLWSLTNCWTRMYLSLHFPSDICVGLLWGAFVGIMVYLLYLYVSKRGTSKAHYVTEKYTTTGYELSDINLIINVLLLTVFYAVFRTLITI